MGEGAMKHPLKHPTSEPLWIAIVIFYGALFVGLYWLLGYAPSHGIALP